MQARGREGQLDAWAAIQALAPPGRRPRRAKAPLIGRDAVYVGKGGEVPPEIPAAFERIEKLPEIPVIVRGELIKSFKLWRCYRFKGMRRPTESLTY